MAARGARLCLSVLLGLALPALRVSAQGARAASALGSITGTVRDGSGVAVGGANVTLLSVATRSRASTTSDRQGRFFFNDLAAGDYTVEVRLPASAETAAERVSVREGQQLVVDLRLENRPASQKAPALKSAADASGSLSQFRYYDNAGTFKPGTVNAAVDPGGYSAAKEADSYRLMLDYLQAENQTMPAQLAPGVHTAGSVASNAPPAAELATWSESEFLSRGSELLLSHNVEASVAVFQAGTGRFPQSSKLRTALGISLLAHGQYDQAIDALLVATDLAPADPQPYFVLAKAYGSSPGTSGEVLQRLRRWLSFDPHNPQACYAYALALAKGGPSRETLKEMESLLQQAVRLDPRFVDAYLELGSVYEAQSDYPAAIRQYEAVARLNPSLASVHYRLAQAYAHTGQPAKAESERSLYEKLRAPSRPPQ
jgi:tetratricopeptide (TPR) repeat protein